MSASPQVTAAAAVDSYIDRDQSDIGKTVKLGGQNYEVFGYSADPVTGFHGTAYLNKDTNQVVIAYRGTDPSSEHQLTRVQDVAVDATMVRDKVNPQIPLADAFTQQMIDKAAKLGIPKDQITAAGHSLGGTETQIEASQFGLQAATYNAYGAADMGYKAPADPNQITNYVMAGDVVSAGNHHLGNVVTLASPQDIQSMKDGRYIDAPPGSQPPNPFLAMSLADHSATHFSPDNNTTPSVLDPKVFAQYEKNYTDNKEAIDTYRNDVYRERGELSAALRQAQAGAPAALPADIHQQLNEFAAVKVDPAIQKGIEQNSIVKGAEQRLQQDADAVRAAGQDAQAQSDKNAQVTRQFGNMLGAGNPVAPLAGVALGEAEHLAGKAIHATGDYAANKLQSAEHAVEAGAHSLTGKAEAIIHSPTVQNAAIPIANAFVDTYNTAQSAGRSIENTYDSAKRSVSEGIDHAEQTAKTVGAAVSKGASDARQAIADGAHGAEQAMAQRAQQASQAVGAAAADVSQKADKAWDTLTHPSSWFDDKVRPAPKLDDPAHPGHDLFKQAQGHVQALDAKVGRVSDQRSDNLAGVAAVAAMQKGMTRIDHILPDTHDGATMFVAQNTLPNKTITQVPTVQAMNTPLEQSSTQAHQLAQQQTQQQQAQAQSQTQNQQMVQAAPVR
ncbi:XVIPCD domain-containing protein [Dyella sp.]|uniref:XVIPCD domain-containing protein n=1 Tax=Dyella sp. TaxID=1869338 RepID=UPI002ED06466